MVELEADVKFRSLYGLVRCGSPGNGERTMEVCARSSAASCR
jgi:hypothetical protein